LKSFSKILFQKVYNNTMKVTVGLPAYNEERNIQNVLKDILGQNQDGWDLKEILVYSDGSSDKTVEKVKELRNPLIWVNSDMERKGQIGRIQEMFGKMSGDVLVMLDGDLRLENNDIITHLIKPFKEDKMTMLVGGNTMAYPPKNFFQRAVYSTFKVFYMARLSIRGGNNMFGCTGGCLAIHKDLAKQITFPKVKNQDAYMYFVCKTKGFTFKFVKEAVVFYKLPNNLHDYLSQVFRSNPEAVEIKLTQYFGDMVKKEFSRGRFFYAKCVLKVFLEDPIPTAYIIMVNALCKPFFPFLSKSDATTWEAVTSTK